MRSDPERQRAPQRIHALDAWRATLLLLGVVLHSVSELLSEMPEGTLKVVYLRLNDFIHTFRMPAFFVLSGFFSAMLLETRGAKAFLWNRCQRIVLPFLVFVPLTGLTLSVLHIARDHILLYQIIAALGSRRTELLGWMVARQFKPFMVFMASHFDYRNFLGSLAHDVTGLRFSSSPKGRDHEFGASARSLDGLGEYSGSFWVYVPLGFTSN